MMYAPDGSASGAWFDLQNGVVGTQTSGVTGRIVALPNGWYRCSVTMTTASTTAYCGVQFVSADNSVSVTANGTDGIYIFGGQTEIGNFATSYIPNFGAAGTSVTRAADNISLATSAFPYLAQPGTLFVETQVPNQLSAAQRQMAQLRLDGSNYIQLNYRSASADDITVLVATAASAVVNFNGGSITSNTPQKVALGWATDDAAAYKDGTQLTTDASCTFASATNLWLGSNSSTEQLNGYIRKLVYLPRRMSNAELTTLTTP
jgi:hypothetical protein